MSTPSLEEILVNGVCGALAGNQGHERQAGSLQAVLIALLRRGGGSVEITKDEFERAFDYDGGIEFDARNAQSLKIALHEQMGEG